MKRTPIYQRQYAKGVHTFTIDGDVTAKYIYFAVKLSAERGGAGTRLIPKTYLAVDNSTFTASYDSNTDKTTLTITILPTDTTSLTSTLYIYELDQVASDDSTTRVPLLDGPFNLDLAALSPYDGSSSPSGEYVNQAYDKIIVYKFVSAGTGSKEIDSGFNATLTPTNEDTGIYKLISNIDIFDANVSVNIEAANNTDSAKMFLFGWYFSDTKTMWIKIFDFFQGAMNSDFRITLRRVRQ